MPVGFVRDPESPVRVFISYSRIDSELAHGLIATLRTGGGPFPFEVLSDLELQPGDIVSERLNEWLESAQIILLLVSENYLSSPSAQQEVQTALERRERGEAAVIPVILTGVNWQNTPYAELHPLPPGARPVLAWDTKEDAFREIRRSLIQLVEHRTTPADIFEPRTSARRHFLNGRFRLLWLTFISWLIFGSLLFLAWYSGHPAAQSTTEPGRFSSTSDFLLNSAAAGIAAMSLIQIFKKALPIRGAFHRDALRAWLRGPAMAELHTRVHPGRISDLFDLPSELLTGQLSAIAEQALDQQSAEKRLSPLILRMAEAAEPPERARRRDRREPNPEAEADRRASLALTIQRNLDYFQIATAAQWRRYLLFTSVCLAAALFVLGLQLFQAGIFIPGLTNTPKTFPQRLGNFSALLMGTVLVGALGGFLASIARDAVAILEKLRR
jgi:hypothetical protein